MAQAGAGATGCDISPAMLACAREAAPGLCFIEADATALPFEDVADQPRAFAEIRHVLRPGGGFVMAAWMGQAHAQAFATIFGALRAHADLSAAPPQPDLFAYASTDWADETLAAAGLRMSAHEVVEAAWILDAPEELFEIFLTATVGAGMLIRSQSDAVIDRIAAAVADTVRKSHPGGPPYRMETPVARISAEAA